MRSLVLLIPLVAGCPAPGPDPVDGGTADSGSADAGSDAGGDGGPFRFEYRYGNQIFGSELSMDELFVLHRTERTCCPPVVRDAGVPTLMPDDALKLYAWFSACHGKPTTARIPDAGAAGDLYGTFEISRGGSRTTLRRSAIEDGGHVIERNVCAALPDAIDFVNAIVDVDMPRAD